MERYLLKRKAAEIEPVQIEQEEPEEHPAIEEPVSEPSGDENGERKEVEDHAGGIAAPHCCEKRHDYMVKL